MILLFNMSHVITPGHVVENDFPAHVQTQLAQDTTFGAAV
jgi:hypothetical protein